MALDDFPFHPVMRTERQRGRPQNFDYMRMVDFFNQKPRQIIINDHFSPQQRGAFVRNGNDYLLICNGRWMNLSAFTWYYFDSTRGIRSTMGILSVQDWIAKWGKGISICGWTNTIIIWKNNAPFIRTLEHKLWWKENTSDWCWQVGL